MRLCHVVKSFSSTVSFSYHITRAILSHLEIVVHKNCSVLYTLELFIFWTNKSWLKWMRSCFVIYGMVLDKSQLTFEGSASQPGIISIIQYATKLHSSNLCHPRSSTTILNKCWWWCIFCWIYARVFTGCAAACGMPLKLSICSQTW